MLAGQETEALHTVRLFVFRIRWQKPNYWNSLRKYQCVYTALKAKFFFIDSIRRCACKLSETKHRPVRTPQLESRQICKHWLGLPFSGRCVTAHWN